MNGVASPHRIWPKYARLIFVFTKILRKHPNIVKIDAIVSYDMKIFDCNINIINKFYWIHKFKFMQIFD